jgi:hypothetical protein
MAVAVAISVPLWVEFIGWHLPRWRVVVLVLLVLSCSPAVQALEMQQISALVCGFMAAGAFLLRRRAYVPSGIFFALATIKPQMVFLLYIWLFLWTLGKWHERKNLLLSLAAGIGALTLAGQWMVPGWLGQFISAILAYHLYAGDSAQSIVENVLWPRRGRCLSVRYPSRIDGRACPRENGAGRFPEVLSCRRFGSGYVYRRTAARRALQSAVASGCADSFARMVKFVGIREGCSGGFSPGCRGNPVALGCRHRYIAGLLLHACAGMGPAVLLQLDRPVVGCRSAGAPANESAAI